MVGRIGNARATLLPGEPAEDGSPTWRLLIQEAKTTKSDRPATGAPQSLSRSKKRRREVAATALPHDPIDNLWSGPVS
jgi:hypothetical protein